MCMSGSIEPPIPFNAKRARSDKSSVSGTVARYVSPGISTEDVMV